MGDDDWDAGSVLAQARAWLSWESELGSPGLPPRTRPVVAPIERFVADAPRRAPEPERQAPAPSGELPPRLPLEDAIARLRVLADEAATCTACRLHEGRTKSVFARGNPAADLVFVGEGPGYNEDVQGSPFVGDAGALLDKMIAAMGYANDAVYICNVVKCRPPENRTPTPDEALACSTFLVPQLELVRPRVIVALGRTATDGLGLVPKTGPWRGTWAKWRGIPVMPTYHPAFLLRSPDQKRVVWQDLQLVMAALGAPRG